MNNAVQEHNDKFDGTFVCVSKIMEVHLVTYGATQTTSCTYMHIAAQESVCGANCGTQNPH